MHLCIFKAACRIDRVLIVFPGVLEGSARGIDQSQTHTSGLAGTVTLLQAEGNAGREAGMKAGQGRAQPAPTGRRSHRQAVMETKVF